MKSCLISVEYTPFDVNTLERLEYTKNSVTCEIYDNGQPVAYLVCDYLTDYVYGSVQSVDNFICSNSNYSQSDFINDISAYNFVNLVDGWGIGAAVTLVNHLLDTQITQPVYTFQGIDFQLTLAKHNRKGVYGFNVQSGLYSQLIENENSFHALNAIYQTNPPTYLSEEEYRSIMAIEAYNKNFFLNLISQNSFDNQSSSESSSSVDLSTINTQLTNIANNLKTTVHDDNTGEDVEVSVTDIIKDKEDTNLIEIQEVETKNKELVPFLNNDEWSF